MHALLKLAYRYNGLTIESVVENMAQFKSIMYVAGIGLEFMHVNFKYLTEKAIKDLRS